MFTFEDCSELEPVSDASEFLSDTLDIRDDNSVLVCFVCRGTISYGWLQYRVNEFFRILTEHQVMSYVSDFVAKIILVLTYNLRSVEQTMDDSLFYVMWVVRVKVKITASVCQLSVHFGGQFRTPLHN
jgi:hypothetical protein